MTGADAMCLHSLFYQKSIEISDGKLRGKFDYVQAQKLFNKVSRYRLWSPTLRSVCVPPVSYNNQPSWDFVALCTTSAEHKFW